MRTPLLRAERLSKRFGAVEAVRDATFEIHPHSIAALLGENGAGKTTLLRMVLGFLNPDSGRFLSTSEKIGYVPERPVFFPWLNGHQILLLTAQAFGFSRLEANREIESVCRQIGFDPRLLGRKVHTFSFGNQKKFSFLQNLLINPELLIVDEPFSALDPVSIRDIRALFRELRAQGKALLLSSHLISEMERICDEIILLKKGHVIIQHDVSRLVNEFLFVSLPKDGWRRQSLDLAPDYIRETRNGVQMLIAESGLPASTDSWPEGTEVWRPDLEGLYFFFSGA